MKAKAKWGFIGDAKKLGVDSAKVVAGQVFENVEDEYGYALIGKGLIEESPETAKPKSNKQALPSENKQ